MQHPESQTQCAQFELDLVRYACRELDDAGMAAVKDHLGSCPSCREFREFIQRCNSLIKEGQDFDEPGEPCPPPELVVRLEAGTLEKSAALHVRAHLLHCKKCRDDYLLLARLSTGRHADRLPQRVAISTDPTLALRVSGLAILLVAALLGYFWETLSFLWVAMAVRLLWGMRRVPHLTPVGPSLGAECPSVSILVAVRNEGLALPQALATLLAQDYPDYEIIVVDHLSTDDTPHILDDMARHDQRLKVIHVKELPSGWLDKPHAFSVAYQHARGEWLAIADTNARWAPDLLHRSLALVQREGWDHLSVIFQVELRRFWEKALFPWWLLSLLLWLEPWEVSEPKSKRYAGSGAFQLVRCSTYEAIDAHRRLAMEAAEHLKLGKLVKEAGFRSGVAWSDELVQLTYYPGLRRMVAGFTKNSFAGCNYRLSLLFFNLVLIFIFQLLPYLGLLLAHGSVQALAGISVLVPILLCAYSGRQCRVSPLYGFTNVLSAAVFSYSLLHSALVVLRRGGVTSRDTFYSLEELRKGVV